MLTPLVVWSLNTYNTQLTIALVAAAGVHALLLLIPFAQSLYTPPPASPPIRITLTFANSQPQDQGPVAPIEQVPPVESLSTSKRPEKLATQNNSHTPVTMRSTQALIKIFASRLVHEEAEQERRYQSLARARNQSTSIRTALNLPHKVTELNHGRVAVTSSLMGQPVCYQFAPDGDPPVVFFEQCRNQQITIELNRRDDD